MKISQKGLYARSLDVRDAAVKILENTTLAGLLNRGPARDRSGGAARRKGGMEWCCQWWYTAAGKRAMTKRGFMAILLFLFGVLASAQTVIHVGAFPNITHSQAMVGKANGWFEKAMGPDVKIEWKSFNAGPSAIEAVFAGAIDMTYIGPNPAISGYVRSNGEALRIVAGATSGGAALVVRSDSGIQKPEDFHGKKVASPQMGNTQDVALRAWLIEHGMKSRDKGGDVQVIPLANPDQLTLFVKKELDAAWAPEPWATRLIKEGDGRLFLDERTLWPNGQFITAHLIVRTKFLKEHPDLVKNWIRAHVELTEWINGHLPEAKKVLNQQIQRETGKALPDAVLEESFGRLQATYANFVPSDHRGVVRGKVLRGKPTSSVTVLPVRPEVTTVFPKVSLDGISLSYGTNAKGRLIALENISLQVNPGEFLCIVGPSGCGKSTLLHLIAGFHQSSGQVLVDGKPVNGPGTDRILIFQELGLFPWLTVGQNVEFGMKMRNISKAERQEKIQYYLRMVHLSKFRDSYTHQLSGGMRQRVALARALATEPDVLLMDEPFAALDAQTRDLLHDELERIWAETGRTIIFVTHNVREAVRLGDRVALMTFRPGRVKQEFPINLPRPRHIEETDVARTAKEILSCLREEINKSLEAEYADEKNK